MPTRYLKPGIRDSERIEALSSPDAEILYYRLLVSVDDFGRADARPLMIKSLCFPIRLRASADKCMQWLQDLVKAQLITIYEVEGKPYLQIIKWDNKPRADHSKFPDPPTDVYSCPQMLPVTVNREPELKPEPIKALSGKPDATALLEFLNEKTGRHYKPVKANIEMIAARLRDGATVAECQQVIAKKCREWAGDEKMNIYLRPATLFNRTKFAQYQGELLCNVQTAKQS